MGGCFKAVGIGIVCFISILFLGSLCSDGSSNSNHSNENYYDNSRYHQILAKNHFVNYMKKNMKDPSSFVEIAYNSNYNYNKECYVVDLTFRAKNSFGGYTVEHWSSDVKFDGTYVRFENIKKLD